MSDPSENIIDASRVAILMKRKKEIISLIIRQTNYDEEKANERLVFWKNNYLDVIKEYMNPQYGKETKKKDSGGSINQQVWGEIRNFMDEGVRLQERRKLYQQYIMKKRLERENAMKEGNKKIT